MASDIEPIDRYKRICSQLDTFCKRMDDTFRLFVQLSTAVVGGFFWIKTQNNVANIQYLFPIVRFIIPVIGISTLFQLWCDHASWWGYRIVEAKLLDRPELRPRYPNSGKLEIFRGILIILICAASFIWIR